MSILSRPRLADALARVFAAVVDPAPKAGVRLPEIGVQTSTISIPTRYRPAAATVYHPAGGLARPPVYINVHGGRFPPVGRHATVRRGPERRR